MPFMCESVGQARTGRGSSRSFLGRRQSGALAHPHCLAIRCFPFTLPPLLDHPVSGRVASSAGGMKNWENFQNMLIQGGMKFLADFVGSFQKSESPSQVTQI